MFAQSSSNGIPCNPITSSTTRIFSLPTQTARNNKLTHAPRSRFVVIVRTNFSRSSLSLPPWDALRRPAKNQRHTKLTRHTTGDSILLVPDSNHIQHAHTQQGSSRCYERACTTNKLTHLPRSYPCYKYPSSTYHVRELAIQSATMGRSTLSHEDPTSYLSNTSRH